MLGSVVPMDDVAAQDIRQRRLPDPIVNMQYVLEATLELTDDQTLPYDVLDALPAQHYIDLVGFVLSMTRRGNMYSSDVFMRGA